MKALLISFIVSSFILFVPSTSLAFECPGDPRCADEDGGGSSNGSSGVGTITPPAGTVPFATSGNPTTIIAGTVKALISLLIIVAFIIAVIWLIIAGIQFILGGGDPKAVSAAWSRIYWGLIGLVVVLGSFAIIKIVETVFGVSILSGNLSLPRI